MFSVFLNLQHSHTFHYEKSLIATTWCILLFWQQDVGVTAVFGLLFFIASCAWSAGVNDVKYWTDFGNIRIELYQDLCTTATCEGTKAASYASLNVSLVSIVI